MTEPATTPQQIPRTAILESIPISEMRVSELAQRDLRQPKVDRIMADLDLEQIASPTVNSRDGHFYIVEGQHRVEALRQSGYGDWSLQCWVYDGLSLDEEAEMFLKLNDTLTVPAYEKYKVAITAGRHVEVDIDRIVKKAGFKVTLNADAKGAIHAVGTLRRIYNRAGGEILARTLNILGDAYGDAGMQASLIDGIAHLCARYESQLDDQIAIEKLAGLRGGSTALLNKAEQLRRATGNSRGICVAAAAADVVKTGKGNKRLPSWWTT